MHKKSHISNFSDGKKTQTQFPRDENGMYDPNGEYREDGLVYLQVKFPKEARLCLGVALKEGDEEDQQRHGHRLEAFDYTEMTVITKKESDDRIDKAIAQVKSLPRTTKAWLINPREEGKIYRNDPVDIIAGIGKQAKAALASGNVHSVGELLALGSDIGRFTRHREALYIPGLVQKVERVRDDVIPTNAPEIKSYLDAENPYKAKYGDKLDEWGEEEWKTVIKNSSVFTGVVCITELVKHIVLQAQRLYKSTRFANAYYFYHDALSQLTHESCVKWMKTTIIPGEDVCIYSRWVKPELGLNDQFGKRWWERPIGNSPEMMPLDNSLNQDIHEAVRGNVAFSLVLRPFAGNDPRLLSMSTPKATAEAYKILNHPVTGISPTPERIVQDITQFIPACWAIYRAKGVYVPGLASHTPGHRHIVTAKKSKNRGGKRTRLEHNPILCGEKTHPDLRALLNEKASDLMAMNSLFQTISSVEDDDADAEEAHVDESTLEYEQDVGQYY